MVGEIADVTPETVVTGERMRIPIMTTAAAAYGMRRDGARARARAGIICGSGSLRCCKLPQQQQQPVRACVCCGRRGAAGAEGGAYSSSRRAVSHLSLAELLPRLLVVAGSASDASVVVVEASERAFHAFSSSAADSVPVGKVWACVPYWRRERSTLLRAGRLREMKSKQR